MPTVLRVGGFAFSIYPDDHPPPHVHVRYSGGQLVMDVESERVRNVRDMSEADIGRARRLVRLHREELLAGWAKWHSEEDR
jgi:hypothetical protein